MFFPYSCYFKRSLPLGKAAETIFCFNSSVKKVHGVGWALSHSSVPAQTSFWKALLPVFLIYCPTGTKLRVVTGRDLYFFLHGKQIFVVPECSQPLVVQFLKEGRKEGWLQWCLDSPYRVNKRDQGWGFFQVKSRLWNWNFQIWCWMDWGEWWERDDHW